MMKHRISILPVVIVLLALVGIMGMSTSGQQSRRIDEIIVHCTATPQGREVTVADIDRWHRQRGFHGIGYHYVIYLDGTVHLGRAIHEVGAHCKGHNAHSIGVCYVGGLSANGRTPKDTRNAAQRRTLHELLLELKRQYPQAAIHGHRDFSAKACPCFNATTEFQEILPNK